MRLVFNGEPHASLTAKLLSIQHSARQRFGTDLIDSVVGYTTLTLFLNHTTSSEIAQLPGFGKALTPILTRLSWRNSPRDPSSCCRCGITRALHPIWSGSQRRQRSASILLSVCTAPPPILPTLRDLPGFCYLGTTSPKLAVPRLATPRSEVPAGSVALADQQTAVYPGPSPGGWRLIGSCPLRLFDLTAAPPALLTIGDSVRFEPVSESEFHALGGSG